MTITYKVGSSDGGTTPFTGMGYANLSDAMNAIPKTPTALTDNYVIDCYNYGEITETVDPPTISSSYTLSGFTITIKAAVGHGFADNIDTGPLRYDATKGAAFRTMVSSAGLFRSMREGITVQGLQLRSNAAATGMVTFMDNALTDSLFIGNIIKWELNGVGSNGIIRHRRGGKVVNNLIYVTGTVSVVAILHDVNSASSVIHGNTIHMAAASSALVLSSSTSGTAVLTSNYVGGATDPNCIDTGFGSTSDYNATTDTTGDNYGTHGLINLVASSQFVSVTPTIENFRVQTESALVGAGVPNSTYPTDIIGQTRSVTTPTIGAYEFVTATGSAVPVIANLRKAMGA